MLDSLEEAVSGSLSLVLPVIYLQTIELNYFYKKTVFHVECISLKIWMLFVYIIPYNKTILQIIIFTVQGIDLHTISVMWPVKYLIK